MVAENFIFNSIFNLKNLLKLFGDDWWWWKYLYDIWIVYKFIIM